MIFTRYGTRWKVDAWGALWMGIDKEDGLLIYGYDNPWMRWPGIDVLS